MEEASDLYSRDTKSKSRRRVFSLEQANKTLPLVSQIVRDAAGLYREMAQLQLRLDGGKFAPHEKENIESQIERQEHRLEGYCVELAEVGCELKDPIQGLVDFVGQHEGHDVFLCWKLGEHRIEYWHDLHSGFAGRRPVSQIHEAPSQTVP